MFWALPAAAQSRESLAGVCAAEVGSSRRAFGLAAMLLAWRQLQTDLQRGGHALLLWARLRRMPSRGRASLLLKADLPHRPPRGSGAARPCWLLRLKAASATISVGFRVGGAQTGRWRRTLKSRQEGNLTAGTLLQAPENAPPPQLWAFSA